MGCCVSECLPSTLSTVVAQVFFNMGELRGAVDQQVSKYRTAAVRAIASGLDMKVGGPARSHPLLVPYTLQSNPASLTVSLCAPGS